MKKILIILLSFMCGVLFVSCDDGEFKDDPVPVIPVPKPLKAVRAEDGDEIVSAIINHEDKTIELSLVNLKSLSNVKVYLSISPRAKLINPTDTVVSLDLTSPYDIIISNLEEELKYTIIAEILPKLKVKELWKKTAKELNFELHNNGAVGISGNYIVVHDRARFSYYNISDGEKVGDMSWKGIDWSAELGFAAPLHMTTDDAGNVVSCNAAIAAGQEIHMYWWEGVTAEPQLLFSYVLDIPNTTNPQVGRKIYVKGDMTKQAYLYLGVSNNNMFLQWEIKNGQVVSQTPKQVNYYIEDKYKMGIQPKIVPIELNENSNYFINRYEDNKAKVAITYMDGETNTPIYQSESIPGETLGGGHAFDYVDMNGMKYIFMIEQNGDYWMKLIFDIRVMMKHPSYINSIEELIHTRDWDDRLYLPHELGKNGNVTGEVKARVAPDGNSAIVAFLCTNSGVIVWEVDLE